MYVCACVCVVVVVGLGVCSFTFLHACLYSVLALPCPLRGGDIVVAIDLCSCNQSLAWITSVWNLCIRFKHGLLDDFTVSRSGQHRMRHTCLRGTLIKDV